MRFVWERVEPVGRAAIELYYLPSSTYAQGKAAPYAHPPTTGRYCLRVNNPNPPFLFHSQRTLSID